MLDHPAYAVVSSTLEIWFKFRTDAFYLHILTACHVLLYLPFQYRHHIHDISTTQQVLLDFKQHYYMRYDWSAVGVQVVVITYM
jgi:hypothetical protein